MAKKDEAELNGVKGVWRTIGGRRVFIRTGQSLSSAMKESGKFPSYKSKNPKRIKTKDGDVLTKKNDGLDENANIPEYTNYKGDSTLVPDVEKYERVKEDIKGARGTQEKSQIERFKNAKTKEEAYKIMREGYKEDVSKSRMTNRKDMVEYIKEQTNIDISNYIEEKAGHSRTYLGVHLEKMPINQKNTIKDLMYQKGIKIEDNGGYGSALYYKKKK